MYHVHGTTCHEAYSYLEISYLRHERHRATPPPGARSPSHSVHVIRSYPRHVKVDHQVYGGDVQSAACYVRAHQHLRLHGGEGE